MAAGTSPLESVTQRFTKPDVGFFYYFHHYTTVRLLPLFIVGFQTSDGPADVPSPVNMFHHYPPTSPSLTPTLPRWQARHRILTLDFSFFFPTYFC